MEQAGSANRKGDATVRVARRISTAAFLMLLALLSPLLTSPASAATVHGVRPADSPSTPTTLASTGLNITVPVIIGITMLILGIGFVAWAFLRKGSTEQHR